MRRSPLRDGHPSGSVYVRGYTCSCVQSQGEALWCVCSSGREPAGIGGVLGVALPPGSEKSASDFAPGAWLSVQQGSGLKCGAI